MPDRNLDFDFEVGEAERHNVAFHFDQLWGPLRISVDGQPVVRKFKMFNFKRVERYEFSVGSTEPHDVRIEKDRKAIVGGFRVQQCVTYVDGHEVGRYSNAA